MTSIFEADYAAAYDAVYREKDYPRETEAVSCIISQYGAPEMRKIVDLGCGTGRHAVLLAERGFHVTGVDRSKAMLDIAARRAALHHQQAKIAFIEGDMRSFASGQRFDIALMMFNVLGYAATNDDLVAALTCARENLVPGGLFIFDFWYGPAVVADPPRHRFKETDSADGKLLRFVSSNHDPHDQCCDVTIRILRLAGDRVAATSEETHRVRYFFPQELDLALKVTGFRLEALRDFPDIGKAPGGATWSAVAIARRVEIPPERAGSVLASS